ncbi:hypothetical protein [Prosthecobacter sp.]|uniref:hypothetical protein n=1 Tax=Prosthecobacter sp. TaxID=1965333 RepID=UPI00378476E8
MKTYTATCLCLLVYVSALSAREFTDLQGRKLEAEITSATNEQVVLKRAADGRSITANVSVFSAEDQQFIREYAAANVKYSFDVRYTKKKQGERKVEGGGSEGTLENWFYLISIRNMSAVGVEGVTVEYSIYMKEAAADGRTPAKVVSSGSEKLKDLVRNETGSIQTKAVEVIRLRPKAGYYFTSGEGGKSDQLAGFALKFTKGGKELYTYSTTPGLVYR